MDAPVAKLHDALAIQLPSNSHVIFGNKIIGKLQTTPDRGCIFSYTSKAAFPISLSLPLEKKEYSEKECLPFFSGLLPDGKIRERKREFFEFAGKTKNYGKSACKNGKEVFSSSNCNASIRAIRKDKS